MYELTTPVQQEVWETVRQINAAWVGGQPERLLELFHDRIVIVSSAGQRYGEGKAACVDSYRSFIDSAKITLFRENDPQVDVYDIVAVVGYRFEIEYTMNDKANKEAGRDTFVLERVDSRWLAVWRQLTDQPVS
jgi:hypothetical protein